MSFWVNLLSLFSTVLLGVLGILGAILGFLVWKQNEMRKDAEREMNKIKGISQKIDILFRSYTKLIIEAREMMTTAKKIMEGTTKKTKGIDKLYSEMRSKNKETEEIVNKINSIRNGIQKDYKSLAMVSEMIPEYRRSDLIAEYEGGTLVGEVKSSREYSSDVIKQALEMLDDYGIKKKNENHA